MHFVIVLCIFIFSSCANEANSEQIEFSQEKSLRFTVEEKRRSIEWIGDSDTRGEGSSSAAWESTSSFINEDGSTASIVLQNYFVDEEVYPQIDGFGSLNTTSMPINLYTFINDFIQALSDNEMSSNFFPEDKIFLKTIIEYDFQDYPKISRYLIGEMFVFDNPNNTYEIPIRLFFDENYADCFIYCEFVDDSYKIVQFDIGKIHE